MSIANVKIFIKMYNYEYFIPNYKAPIIEPRVNTVNCQGEYIGTSP